MYALALQADGTILMAGAFTTLGGNSHRRVARLSSLGVPDATFDPEPNSGVNALALQDDGKVLIGGNFNTVGVTARSHFARLTNATASQDLSLDATGTVLTWTRAGASPEVDRVTVESSPDGVTWSHVGLASRVGATANWEYGGLLLPPKQNYFLRTRGFQTQGSINGGDASVRESVRLVFLEPEISVEQPVGVNLVSGTSAVDFGSARVGFTSLANTFTIKNAGPDALDITGITTTGGNSGDFMVNTTSMDSGLASGESTTFVVTFNPTATGSRSTTLRIESSDTDEGTFEINLTGTGAPATHGEIAFQDALVSVNEGAVILNLTVTRSNGSDGPVSATVNSSHGTTTAADFNALTNASVSFLNGETSKTVPVTILNDAISEPNETFTVTLSDPQGGATLGAQQTVTVRILDPDTIVPVVTIAAPAANVILNLATGTTVDISGTATDNKGVKQVLMSVNGAPFTDVPTTPAGSTSPTSVSYTRTVTPLAGVNTVSVKSIDHRNNTSTTVTRTFTVWRPMAINANTALGSVTAGFSPSSFREVGKSYTLTATAKPPTTTPAFAGTIFTGWTITGQDVANGNIAFTPQRINIAASSLEKNSLTFVFREGLILTANFVANPFAPLVGTYNGLIRRSATLPDRAPTGIGSEDGTVRSNSTEGFFTATLQNTGAFSGKLTIDGLVLNVAGSFDHNGDARFGTARTTTLVVPRTNKPSLVVSLHLNTAENQTNIAVDDKIIGTVTATDFKRTVVTGVSNVDSDRAFYNGTTVLVPGVYLAAANANGVFNSVLPAKAVIDQTSGFDAKDYPQGDGIATVTITKGGVVTVAGTLADNTAVTASSTLSEIGATHASRFPLFATLYTAKGFLSGFVQLDSTQADSDMSAVNLQWLRPFQGTSHYYPYGWPEVIKVDLLGAKYVAGTTQSSLKATGGANVQPPDADGNAKLTLSDGQLTESLEKFANVSTADVVTKVPVNDPTFTLAITRASGAISGSFTHTDDTVATFKGTLYQKGANAGGFGFFLTKQPAVIDYKGESGGVTLIGQP